VSTQTKHIAFEESEPQRLDVFLSRQLPGFSRSQIQRLIKNGCISVNGEIPRKTGLMLEAGCQICVEIPSPEPSILIPEETPLQVIYEDENLLVIDKPAGMVVHPSAGHNHGTLVHAALGYSPFLAGIGGVMRPGIVHRLDKDTSGIILIARNETAHRWLQLQFKERKVSKKYLALVDGRPPTPSGRIVASIMRDRNNRKKMAIAPEGQGRQAETEYKTLQTYKHHTYLEVHPLTGRTHQIRVHMASLGCPIAADRVYGFRTPSIKLSHHFLHASQLTICLPQEKQARTFQSEIPQDLADVLKNLF